jgi:hypothetical protein
MSWGAQNRSKDAKTPSAGRGMSEKPELGLRPVQQYTRPISEHTTTLQISSDIKYRPHSSARFPVYAPLNMKLSFAHSNVAAVEGA